MAHLRRWGAVAFLAVAGSILVPAGIAFASHCPPTPGIDDPNWCHNTPPPGQGTPQPETPAPTPVKTAAPTAAPTTRPRTTTTTPRQSVETTEPTPFQVETDTSPAGSPEIVVEPDVGDEKLDIAEPAVSGAGTAIVTFIIGFILGGLVGRASWGLRNRRRSQIFG